MVAFLSGGSFCNLRPPPMERDMSLIVLSSSSYVVFKYLYKCMIRDQNGGSVLDAVFSFGDCYINIIYMVRH